MNTKKIDLEGRKGVSTPKKRSKKEGKISKKVGGKMK